MELLEEAGYIWVFGEKPTHFNRIEFRTSKQVIEVSESGRICEVSGICRDAKPLRKVVRFEVGDTVRVREDFEKLMNKDGASSITKLAIIYAGKTFTIRDTWPAGVYSTHKRTYEMYEADIDGYRLPKKWLEPVASRRKEN